MTSPDSLTVLVTGGTGFLGSRLVEILIHQCQCHVRVLARQSAKMAAIVSTWNCDTSRLEVIEGDLLCRQDCETATSNVSLIYHLAAGTGTKSYPEAFRNSVITTRNLLDAVVRHGCLQRFVNVSSFAVYTNQNHGRVLDESCSVDDQPHLRGEAYTYAKAKQDKLVAEYGAKYHIPFVTVRPGVIYGPGKHGITSGRIGLSMFSGFVHLGGNNPIPLTYLDNCAEAILATGTTPAIEGEIFNIVDDELPSSRKFLQLYKKFVEPIRSIYVPRWLLYVGCLGWEKYCQWSGEQLPPVLNRGKYRAYWKKTDYSNAKLKQMTGWRPTVSTSDGLARFFDSCRLAAGHG
jgi:nucleoside-diphosphate-sugar epimerase